MNKYAILVPGMILTSLIQAESLPVLLGTSQGRNNGSKGIYATTLDGSTGKFSATPKLVAEINSPGFQVLHDTLPVLYSIGATLSENEPSIFSFSIQSDKGQVHLKPISGFDTMNNSCMTSSKYSSATGQKVKNFMSAVGFKQKPLFEQPKDSQEIIFASSPIDFKGSNSLA